MMVRTMGVFTLAALLVLGMASTAVATTGDLSADLAGFKEVGGGDPDGSGTATVSANSETGEVCFAIAVSGVDAPSAAHIHVGASGTNGGVVVDFDWAGTGGNGCVSASPAVVASILNIPSAYYVNVHNEAYPGGAVRGQLAASSTGGAAGPELAFTGTNLTAVLAVAGGALILGGSLMVRAGSRRRDG